MHRQGLSYHWLVLRELSVITNKYILFALKTMGLCQYNIQYSIYHGIDVVIRVNIYHFISCSLLCNALDHA